MEQNVSKRKIGLTAEEAVAERQEAEERDWYATQFKHYYNLYSIYGQPKIEAFKKEMRLEGLSEVFIANAERRGALLSNWTKDKYLTERVEHEGIIPHNISKSNR